MFTISECMAHWMVPHGIEFNNDVSTPMLTLVWANLWCCFNTWIWIQFRRDGNKTTGTHDINVHQFRYFLIVKSLYSMCGYWMLHVQRLISKQMNICRQTRLVGLVWTCLDLPYTGAINRSLLKSYFAWPSCVYIMIWLLRRYQQEEWCIRARCVDCRRNFPNRTEQNRWPCKKR